MNTIFINQFIFCKSYQDALSLSKAFDGFSFRVFFLGDSRLVRAKRFIGKVDGSKYYPYRVLIRYEIGYHGFFDSYGFLDIKTIKRFPGIVEELKAATEDKRWKIAFKYEGMDETGLHEVFYYESFDWFYKEKLKPLLNRVNLACQVAFARQVNTSFFEVTYEEKGLWYSRTYLSENSINSAPLFEKMELSVAEGDFIPVCRVWEWSQKHYYNKKDVWSSEARAWVSLSNALNHIGYESLLYSIIGLEYVYTNSERGIKQQLRESIPIVIKGVTSDEIKNLYKIRSDFAHGSIAFPIYGDSNYDQEYHNVNRAAAILLETVRLLVKNEANRIYVVNGEIHFIKDDTVAVRSRKWSDL